jgi:hypothetical protein
MSPPRMSFEARRRRRVHASVTVKSTRSPIIDGRMRNRYANVVKREFHVTLLEHDEGVSVSCPELYRDATRKV